MDLLNIFSDFWHLGDAYWLPKICVILSFFIVVWRAFRFFFYSYPENKRIKRLWLLTSIMFFVWSLGLWLYMYAIDNNPQINNDSEFPIVSGLELWFRSAVASLDMFMFNIESNIIDHIKDLPLVRGLISFLSLIAGTLTIWLIVSLFGERLWSSVQLWWCSHINSDKELCIFFGINEASKLLADSIKKDAKDREFQLVFVEFPIVNNDDLNSGWGGFIKSVTHRVDTFRVARSYGAHMSLANARPNSLNINASKVSDKIFQRIGLSEISRMILKTNNKVHLFFLSENETSNIQSVQVLKHDSTILEKSDHYECIFYCQTRNNSIHRVIENDQSRRGIEVKVIDTSRLCVDFLKYKPELHPVNYVDVQDDASVSSPFNALVVGFGEVGLDAVRFLYEFGAFVKTGSTSQHVERSDFHCNVVDKNMPDLAGQFIVNAPAIKPSMSFVGDSIDEYSLITLHNMDCQSVFFYQKLEEWIQHLNYIVIATGDDEMNISLAVRMLRMAIRCETNFDYFRIMVRIKHDENGHFGNIAQYYNRLWSAEMKKDERDNFERQKHVLSSDLVDSPISLFGSLKDIYKYDYIVSDVLLDQAKKFKDRYDTSVKALQIQSGNDIYPTMTWEEEINTYLQLDGDYADYSPTFSNVMKLRRMQSQNYENCFHIYTKQRLAMFALGADEYKALISHQLFRKNNETIYSWRSGIKPKDKLIKVLDTLAQTEHLRWNASHEVLGYQDKGDENYKDEARLYHGCIKNWSALSENIKSYDYNVVDVSLDIIDVNQ